MKHTTLVFCASALSAVLAAPTSQIFAPSIDQCPPLPRREQYAASVHDLRPDDFEVIAGIGDSLMAAVFARNADTPVVHKDQLNQYPGVSFVMGGDSGQVTLPNLLQHYSRQDLVGASVGERPLKTCPDTFFCLEENQQVEDQDHLNAAFGGATSQAFEGQIRYLIKHFGKGTPLANKWKMLTVYIGHNDLAVSCMPEYSFEEYRKRMEAGLQLLKDNVDKVHINLVGLMHIEKIHEVTSSKPGYIRPFEDGSMQIQNYECVCCLKGQTDTITRNVPQFDSSLKVLAAKFSDINLSSTFSVTYQPLKLDLGAVPPEVFR
ncbi:hypothetical protein BCR43DRAFT_465493 [Syncephalastrum racemosum]|uniref:SGNH hydrolase-type esterase domain-containing protein n=1 Tax=Syncephalastrum racemosum TaxID=13706 RepID=A0A1X2HSI5_SYNRA|nr:hypothetical protein BCR43DRAFT_465493 [Syncephalastrum racemosum]